MIKLNLLPSYVVEARRIRVVVAIFFVLLGLEAGVVYKAYTDLRAQETWFTSDKDYFLKRAEMIKAEKGTTEALKGKSGVYAPYIAFFSRNAVIQYTEGIAATCEEVAQKVGGGRAWFNDLKIEKSGAVTINGQIRGMLNFLDYYFTMKDKGYTIAPAARVATSPASPTLNQLVPVAMTGTVEKKIPDKPAPPVETVEPGAIFTPAGAAPPPGAPGAAAPPAGAPGGG